MSSLKDLVKVIEERSREISERYQDDREPLDKLFVDSIDQSMHEIKDGADPDDFTDLCIINFIIHAANAGYEAVEIKQFVNDLTNKS